MMPAAETGSLLENARAKFSGKHLDFIVANDVTRAGAGFGTDTNIITVVHKDGRVMPHDLASKEAIAGFILDQAKEYFQ